MTDIYALLTRLGIPYLRYDHPPVDTCEAFVAAVPDRDAMHTKNLFLRDKRGRRHVLVVTSCAKTVDIKALADLVSADTLSFASAERMDKYLGVKPGSVTILGLVNDVSRAVEVVIDAEVWASDRWCAHPLVNTATLVIAREDVVKFLAQTGHAPRVLALPAR